ncbi:DUF1003 domain-containing protein [Phenylobacterium sp.]|uniref:DUF1003 domain-containing protein n=1 Tax=Phenylobacterium sp. TaxID=1871053 RepID=UPI00374C8B3A
MPAATAPTELKAPMADHVTETVDVIAAFHKAHADGASPLQKAMDAMTDRLGRPILVAGVILAIAAWISGTLALGEDVDQPLFTWLELAATVFALLVALLILVTQRRQDQLSERRAQLTLELAIVADRKTAKLIALMEEFRRDHPDLADRDDAESREMAKPTDAETVLAAIDERSAKSGEAKA